MGDFNAKVGRNDASVERIMGKRKMGDQLQRWKRHFESVLKRPAPSQLPDPRPADVALNINTGPISRGEISTALTQLKNAKAPGVNNIPTEALKEGGPCTVEALHRT